MEESFLTAWAIVARTTDNETVVKVDYLAHKPDSTEVKYYFNSESKIDINTIEVHGPYQPPKAEIVVFKNNDGVIDNIVSNIPCDAAVLTEMLESDDVDNFEVKIIRGGGYSYTVSLETAHVSLDQVLEIMAESADGVELVI